MARAYSLDLRERVVAAVAAGQSCRSVAKTFVVSVASVVKWSQRQRALGSPAAARGSDDDARDLICLAPQSASWLIRGWPIVGGTMTYRGNLTVVCVPRGSQWSVTTAGGATTAAAEPLAAKPPDDDHRQRYRRR